MLHEIKYTFKTGVPLNRRRRLPRPFKIKEVELKEKTRRSRLYASAMLVSFGNIYVDFARRSNNIYKVSVQIRK